MKRSRIRPVSDKQTKELTLRAKLSYKLLGECGGKCMTCGEEPDWRGLSLSHLIPLSQAGKTNSENCILECGRCHSKRHGIKEVGDDK